VQSSLTGTFGGCIVNGGTYNYPFTYTISTANTWTTISVSIPAPTSGWTYTSTTNGVGLQIFFNLGTGSTYSGTAGAWASSSALAPTGAVSVVGTNGATLYITGVQLEVGSSATGFEYRQYTTELQLCQRYYEVFSNEGVNYQCFAAAWADPSGPNTFSIMTFKVTKRTAPTMSFTAANTFRVDPGNVVCTAITADQITSSIVRVKSTQGSNIPSNYSGALLHSDISSVTTLIMASAEL
jgi:hypothetical protein